MGSSWTTSTKQPITENSLRNLVGSEIASALGNDGSQLQRDRALAMDYYQGRPFGNEVEGRSQVVSTDVRDTIEWIMPTIMRIFTSGEQVVEFQPEKESDEQVAQQATEYCQFIWNRDNPGYVNFYVWFKDALMQKNGVLKIFFDESEEVKRERYTGLDDHAFAELVNDDSVTVSEHTERQEEIEMPAQDPQTGQIVIQKQPIELHDLVITRRAPKRRVRVENMPPEEFLISRDGRDIQQARFAAHRKRTTVSDIRTELLGIMSEAECEEIMSQLSGDADTTPINLEEVARNTVENYTPSANVENTTESLVWRTECYLRADVDGDGISEMRKITVAGPGHVILTNESWDGPRPFVSVTPIIMPHRFWGISVSDLVMDLQLIRSTLLRQLLDNMYLSNNQRTEVVANNIIDPTEVLTSRPGGVIRVKQSGSVNPIPVPQIGQAAIAGLEYIDHIREIRTGVSERTQGIGANSLHETAAGEQMLMSAAMGKIELIARTFAETGVKDAFRMMLQLICRYQNEARTVRLTGGWVEMDPRSWDDGMSVVASVGLGTGDNQVRLGNAQMLGQMQMTAGQTGILQITPDNAMATAELAVNAMGLKRADRYFTKPMQPIQRQHPMVQKAQIQAGVQQQKMQQDAQIQSAQMQQEAQLQAAQQQHQAELAAMKAQQDAQVSALKTQHDAEMKAIQANNDAAIRRYQIDSELALKREQMHAELELKREALLLDAEHKRHMLNQQAAHIGGDTRIKAGLS